MLEMDEIRNLALKLHDANPLFSIMDESEISRIVVLQNHDRYTKRWIDAYVT
jgi:tRNA wybutosine-synthesizing protein 1